MFCCLYKCKSLYNEAVGFRPPVNLINLCPVVLVWSLGGAVLHVSCIPVCGALCGGGMRGGGGGGAGAERA